MFKILLEIIKENAGTRVNGKIASERTFTARKESLVASFRCLQRLGFKLQDPRNLSEKHVKALMHHWIFEKKACPKTIETNLSNLRIYCQWIGKSGVVKNKLDYVEESQYHLLKVSTVAKESRSPAGKGIDVTELFKLADEKDYRLGLMLRLETAFGLRREEVLKCRPHVQDFTHYLDVEKGHGKGGKQRKVPPLTSAQVELIEMVKKHIPPAEAMGWPYTKNGKERASLEQNITRYKNYMTAIGLTKKKLGVTGHSLRAQYAENNALVHGIMPPSLGGVQGQLPKMVLRPILLKLSQAMGHDRTKVMSAYYCSFGKRVEIEAEQTLQKIEASLMLLAQTKLEEVEEKNWEDCCHIREMLGLVGLDINLKQTQHLWHIYSRRNGVDWVKPEHEIAICMQSSANQILQLSK